MFGLIRVSLFDHHFYVYQNHSLLNTAASAGCHVLKLFIQTSMFDRTWLQNRFSRGTKTHTKEMYTRRDTSYRMPWIWKRWVLLKATRYCTKFCIIIAEMLHPFWQIILWMHFFLSRFILIENVLLSTITENKTKVW